MVPKNLRIFICLCIYIISVKAASGKNINKFYNRIDSIDSFLTIHQKVIHEFGESQIELEEAYKILMPIYIRPLKDKKPIPGNTTLNFIENSLYKEDSIFLNATNLPNLWLKPFSLYTGLHIPLENYSNLYLSVWDHFLNVFPVLKNNNRYQTSLFSLSSHILVLDLQQYYSKCVHSLSEKEKSSFRKNSHEFLRILTDLQYIPLKSKPKTYWIVYKSHWEFYFEYLQNCLDTRKKPDTIFINKTLRKKVSEILPNSNHEPFYLESEKKKLKFLISLYNKYKNENFNYER